MARLIATTEPRSIRAGAWCPVCGQPNAVEIDVHVKTTRGLQRTATAHTCVTPGCDGQTSTQAYTAEGR